MPLRLRITVMTVAFAMIFSNNISAQTGNVGIGTTTPLARLHVADSGVVFTGSATLPASPGNPPVSGPGARMMWYPQKAAFRVGSVDAAKWNKDSIGLNSFATGFNTRANGNYSTSMGFNTSAFGSFSTSMGSGTIASGDYSTSLGRNTIASRDFSTSMGLGTIASGSQSTSMGGGTIASGFISTSMGFSTTASGDYTTSIGLETVARAYASTVLGMYNDSVATSSKISRVATDPVFMIGNGTSDANRSNAMTVLKNGNTGIGISNPVARLHVVDSAVLFTGPTTVPFTTPFAPPASGSGTRMMWYPQKAAFRVGTVDEANWDKDSIGLFSFASGRNTKAKGFNSISMGENATASGTNSICMGASSTASGGYSTCIGANNRASGIFSTSIGRFTNSSGDYSTSMGRSTSASGFASTSMGENTNASGSNSTSMGEITIASSIASTSMGSETIASGAYSTSMGRVTSASGFASTSMGAATTAFGDYSTSMGAATVARSYASVAMGMYNDSVATANPTSPVATDPVFMIGNGTSDANRSNAMTVLKNGNTGIGTSQPQFRMHVVTNDAQNFGFRQGIMIENTADGIGNTGEAAISFKNSGDAGTNSKQWMVGLNQSRNFAFAYGADFAGGTVTKMLLDSTGQLGIGTTAPTEKLHVIGNIFASGTITPSDLRYKKNIEVIDHPLEKIDEIRGVTYDLKTDEFPESGFSNEKQAGVIAQEVEAVLPQVVVTDKNGYKAVDYSKIVPLLIEGIKAQQKQIEDLKKRVKRLEKK